MMKFKDLLSESDKALFKEAVGKVKPVTTDTVRHRKNEPAMVRKQQKQRQESRQTFYFSDEFEPNLEATGPMKYVRDDVDSFEAKRLRRGDYYPEITLDLHGLNQQQSKLEIAALLSECIKRNINCACIIHGIGSRVLKHKVPHWLVQHPDVMAFHQAPLEFGGDGALLVLIELKEAFLNK
ncbi:endonuclease SmrB [Thalassotalea maritima]|uniref:endonuclease SmrB n=1 Tax=Thalassotalea maritima TaxID=3242416 RepID=UPI0035284C98